MLNISSKDSFFKGSNEYLYLLDIATNSEIGEKIKKEMIPQWEKEAVAKGKGGKNTITLSYGENHRVDRELSYYNGNPKKDCRARHKANGQWKKSLGVRSNFPLYHEDLLDLAKDKILFLHEGEKACDYALSRGFISTSFVGSLANDETYIKEKLTLIKEKEVKGIIYFADNDEQGIKKAIKVRDIATSINFPCLIIPIKEILPIAEKGDDFKEYSDKFPYHDTEMLLTQIQDFIMERFNDLINIGVKEETTIDHEKQAKSDSKIVSFPSKLIDKNDIQTKLRELLEKGLKPSQEILELNEIARDNGLLIGEIKEIYRSLKDEDDNKELTIDLTEKLGDILDIEKINLDLPSVLPQEISTKLIALAIQMKVAPEHLLTAMLPTWSSMIGTKSKVVISTAMGYTQPSILRTMIVANSGDRKSPILKNATSAIVEINNDWVTQYKREIKDYEETLRQLEKGETPPPKPVAKRCVIDDFNYDGMVKTHSQNENGLLGYVDELKGYFTRMNKQTGKGDDEQKDLQLFNGSPIMKDRQSEECSYYLSKSALSLVGTIQWDILGNLIKSKGDGDSAGVICRWLMCAKPLGISKLDLFSGADGLFDDFKIEQKELLLYLRSLPNQDYLLSDSAKKLWQQYQHHLEDLRAMETNEALSVAYPKYESYMSRLALVLHCVESYFTRTLSATISGATMKRAIALTQFYLNQYRYVLAKISPSQSLTGDILKIRDLLNKTNSLTVTQVKDRFKHLRTKDGRNVITTYFETLVNSNFADWEIKGKKIKVRKEIRTNQERNQDKSGNLKPFNINSFETTSGQVRTKSGHLKTSNINSLEIESGQNNNFNFFLEDSEIQGNEDNTSISVESSQENKIVSQEKCPDLGINSNNGNGLECPDSVLICPDETLKPSQDKGLECPDLCPDLPENVLISDPAEKTLSEILELSNKLNYDYPLLENISYEYFHQSDLTALKNYELNRLKRELKERAKMKGLI